MAKNNQTKKEITKGRAVAKAAKATQPRPTAKQKTESAPAIKTAPATPRSQSKTQAPASADIRQNYKKSLLGKYLDKHRGQPAIKPKK